MSKTILRRRGCVCTECMLGGVPTICPHKAVSIWLFANLVHGGGNGVHDIVIERPASKRQPAG